MYKKKRGKEIHIKMRTLSAGWSSARHSANVSVVHFKWPCYPSPCLSGPDIKQSLTQQGWILLMEKWMVLIGPEILKPFLKKNPQV